MTILICTGPTGGHFFPALSTAEKIKADAPNNDVHLLVNRLPDMFQSAARKSPISFHVIRVSPLGKLFSFKTPIILIEYIIGIWTTFWLLFHMKPKVVIGFGSYGSVPAVLVALFLRIPVIIHEQNMAPGRANRLLGRWAKKIAISFPAIWDERMSGKFIWTGYPLRASFKKQLNDSDERSEHAKRSRRQLLVFGGSQGAARINQFFLEAMERMSVEERSNYAVIHIIGNDRISEVKEIYRRLEIPAEVYSFSDQIPEYLGKADLVISRAGAGTVFELAATGRAAIIIPYPYAGGHQKYNAKYLADRHAAWVIEESHLSSEFLKNAIIKVTHDETIRKRFEQQIHRLAKLDADEQLARLSCGFLV